MKISYFKLPILIFFVFSINSKIGNSQFLYTNAGIGFRGVVFDTGTFGVGGNTSMNVMTVNIDATYRVIRNFGLGFTIGIPVLQNSKYNFNTSASPTFRGFQYAGLYKPSSMDYSFEQGLFYSIHFKGFFETIVNSYAKIHFGYSAVTENFKFIRGYKPAEYSFNGYTNAISKGELKARNDIYTNKHHVLIPGISVGMMPTFAKHFFVDVNIGVDFMIFESKSFRYNIEYEWSHSYSDYSRVKITGKAKGLVPAFVANVGFGYYF